jgi:hypothetical protein
MGKISSVNDSNSHLHLRHHDKVFELNPYFVIYVSKHSPFIAIIQCIANENVIKPREENFLMGSKSERKMFSHLNVYRRSILCRRRNNAMIEFFEVIMTEDGGERMERLKNRSSPHPAKVASKLF